MDIKIHFTKKSCLAFSLAIFCGLIALSGWYLSPQKARHDIKVTCHNNCDCFDNVVDYRLTNEQARLFSQFMKELGKRRNANVLEFMDAANAFHIQQAFAICQLQGQISAEKQIVADKIKNKK